MKQVVLGGLLILALLALPPLARAQSQTCKDAAAGLAPPAIPGSQPLNGPPQLSPTYSVTYTPAPSNAVPPCSLLAPGNGPEGPDPMAAADATARARAAAIAKQEEDILQETAQLVQLAQALQMAMTPTNPGVTSADTAKEAAEIEKLIRKIEAGLKAEHSPN